MLKRLALLLAIIMTFSLLSLSITVSAATVTMEKFDSFTFIDVEYSLDLDLYVAVGNTNANKGTVFVSNDGEKWGIAATLSETLRNTDCLVWWKSQQCFVLYCGDSYKTYASYDGYNWTANNLKDLKYAGGINAAGEDLMYYVGSIARIYTDFQTYKEYTYATGATYNASIGNAAGNGDERTIFVVDGYRGGITINGGASWENKSPFAEGFATISDTVYSAAQDCFFLTGVTQGARIMKMSMAGGGTNISPAAALIPDTTRFPCITVGNGYILVGSNNGKFYKEYDSSAYSKAWVEIPADGDAAGNSAVRRLAYGKDKFVAVINKTSAEGSKSKIAVFDKDLNSYKIISSHYTGRYAVIFDGSERIENPQVLNEPVTFSISAEIIDVVNKPITDFIKDMTISGQLPNGISYLGNGGFLVNPGADAGNITLSAISQNGVESNFKISFIKAASIVLGGSFNVAIPAFGDADAEYYFTADVFGNDNSKMSGNTNIYPVTNLPENVTFDGASKKLSIKSTAESGNFTLRAESTGDPNIYIEKTVIITPREAKSIKIISGKSDIIIPDAASLTEAYKAEVRDQEDKLMPFEEILWSIKNTDILGDILGISLTSGQLTVSNTASEGNYEIEVKVKNNPLLTFSYPLTLEFSDSRRVDWDIANVTITGDLSNISDNLTFASSGANGTTIKWKSSNASVITDDGVVTQPSRENTRVTLTATVSKGTAVKTKTFELTVLKSTNLIKDGKFESATAESFSADQASDAAVTDTNTHSGSYALKVYNRQNGSNGVSHLFAPVSGSSYLVTFYAKSGGAEQQVGFSCSGVNLSASNVGQEYKKVSGILSYSSLTSNPQSAFNITASGLDDFYIDDFSIIEVTLEYDALMSAVQKAEYSKSAADIAAAKALADGFYECPEKDGAKGRINAIVPINSGNGNSGTNGTSGLGGTGGGAGGSKGSVSVGLPSVYDTPPDNSQKVEEAALTFKDLLGHWAKDDVELMAGLGFVKGRNDGAFEPDANITRAEFAALAVRIIGSSEKPYLNSFYDVITDDWYSGSVEAAKEMGLITGNDGLFRPNDLITREEMTKIVVSAYCKKTNTALKTGGALYYADYYKVSGWAYDYVAEAVDIGLINGMSETEFAPSLTATRAQAAVILKRMYDTINK